MAMETKTGARILIIDDEKQIRRLLNVSLTGHGYRLEEAESGLDGLNKAVVFRPDLIILDLGLPDLDGLEIIRQLREWSKIPVIILSVREQENDKITALDAGADDYVTKPFGMGELLARIRTTLRHAAGLGNEPVLDFGDLVVDVASRRVTVDRNDEEFGRLCRESAHTQAAFTSRLGPVLRKRHPIPAGLYRTAPP